MKKIFRFNELNLVVRDEMVKDYVEQVGRNEELLKNLACDYYRERGEVFDSNGNPVA